MYYMRKYATVSHCAPPPPHKTMGRVLWIYVCEEYMNQAPSHIRGGVSQHFISTYDQNNLRRINKGDTR